MKIFYAVIGLAFIITFNIALIKRDKQLFEAYDKVCAELPQPHPNCRYAK